MFADVDACSWKGEYLLFTIVVQHKMLQWRLKEDVQVSWSKLKLNTDSPYSIILYFDTLNLVTARKNP